MHSIWSFLQQTAAASATVLLLLLLRRIFRDKLSPRCLCALWTVFPIRLLIPVGLLGFVTTLDLTYPVDLLRTAIELNAGSAYSSPWLSDLPALPIPLPPTAAPRSVTDWLFLIYLAGVLGFAVYFLLAHLRLRRILREAVPVSAERSKGISELAASHKLPMPAKIVAIPGLQAPFLVGIFRATLVLPAEGVDKPVILHELFHLRYRDLLSGWLDTCFRCLHWPNPLLWYALDQMANDREARCDQQVLELLQGEERRDYGRLLLTMADDAHLRTPGATTMANGAKHIKDRIKSIVRFRLYPSGMSLVAWCMALSIALSMALGYPAAAAVVKSSSGNSLPEILAQARQHRPTTVLGALDTFAKSLYAETYNPNTARLYRAMALPESERHNLPELIKEWKDNNAEERFYRDNYATGPLYYGAVPDGEGWLCQVAFFRDAEPVKGQKMNEIPIDYRVHTVSLQPDGRYWSACSLGYTEGQMPADAQLYRIELLPGAVVWTAEAGGVEIRVEPVHTMRLSTGGFINGQTRDTWDFLTFPKRDPSRAPILDEAYLDIDLGWRVTFTNRSAETVDIDFTLKAHYTDPERRNDSIPGGTEYLAPGQSISSSIGGGGGAGSLDDWLDWFAGYSAYDAVLSINGQSYTCTLEREVNIP